jgi:hypothetical protein
MADINQIAGPANLLRTPKLAICDGNLSSKQGLAERTVDMCEARLGLIGSFGSFARAHEDVGPRQHGSDGQDLVGAPARRDQRDVISILNSHQHGLEDFET